MSEDNGPSAGSLPDPRTYGAGAHRFDRLAAPELRVEVERALREKRQGELEAALRAAPTHAAHARLWNVVCEAAHAPDPDPAAASTRIFALPLVIVTGGARPAVLPGVLPDIAGIAALFGQYGALGRTGNFGFTNALCDLGTLERVTPVDAYEWTHAASAAPRELAPAPVVLSGAGEEAHLRFLVGAGIVGGAEPSFVETASNIGAWGMPLTRALAAQIAQPGVEALPLARPPLELLRAAHAGRCAQLETALNLFVSNAVRRFRASVGDPVAIVSAHDNAELRVSLSSPYDAALHEGFCWPLHPLDDIAQIGGEVAQLLAACRVHDVSYIGQVLPAQDGNGRTWFPAVGELSSLVPGSRH